jgi:hypothetical protein
VWNLRFEAPTHTGGMNILKKMGREPTMPFFFESPSDKSIFRLKAIILNNIHLIFHPKEQDIKIYPLVN